MLSMNMIILAPAMGLPYKWVLTLPARKQPLRAVSGADTTRI